MKSYYFKLVLLLTFISCNKSKILNEGEQLWLQNNPNLKVAVCGFYPPYLFENHKGNMDGVFIDYLSLIESKIDYSFTKINYYKWSDLYQDALEGEIDIILDIQKTDSRAEIMDFYSDIFSSNHVVVSREGDTILYKDLATKKVVVPKDYAIYETLKTNIPNIDIYTLDSEMACLKALSKGNYDVYIGPTSVTNYFIHNLNLSNLNITDKTPFNYEPGISVNKNQVVLSTIISKVVKSISHSEKETIFENWLYSKIKPFYRKFYFWLAILGILGTLVLISLYFNKKLKRKVLERTKELQIAVENAERSNEVKTRFIQNISHEIRTPMNSILGFSELLRKENSSNEEHLGYIGTIIDSGKHLIHVIDSILEISNFRTNEAEVNLEVIDIKSVMQNILNHFKSISDTKKITFNVSTNIISNESILIDKNRLQKIVTNLLDNAIKFTNVGSVSFSYNLNPDTSLEIIIIDTGKGIREEDKKAIFDAFFQLENKDNYGYVGLGLGLTIVKENVKILNGEIDLKSNLNSGSTFKVKLPCKRVTNLSLKEVTSTKEKHTILVFEDADLNFLLVKSILLKMKDYDFTILRGENGQLGVDICMARHIEIDLIIMDIRMPIMDGYEATKIIKDAFPDIPIIAHTAYSTNQDIKKALQVGCETVLAKPIELDLFKETIKKFITKKTRTLI